MPNTSGGTPVENEFMSDTPLVLMVAAAGEAQAVAAAWAGTQLPDIDWQPVRLDEWCTLIRTGVGKVNAAAAAAMLVRSGQTVINLGICGALPGAHGGSAATATIGDVIVASASVYADEGLETPRGFVDLASLGFPPGGPAFGGVSVPIAPPLLECVRNIVPAPARSGPIATVSTCSGTDERALAVANRTGAIAEAMEGAAIAHVLARLRGGPGGIAEVRVVSNTTGDRDRQVWRIAEAFGRLTDVARAIRAGARDGLLTI